MIRLIVPLFMILINTEIIAQAVGIGTPIPDNSALLELASTQKGMLVPRMTAAQRLAIVQPATGLIVYQTNGSPGFYYNNGTPLAPNWLLLINSGASLGQSAQTVFGSGSVTIMTLSAFTLVPGLTQTINLSSTSLVYIATDGGITTTSSSPSGISMVDIGIIINGQDPSNGGWQRISVSNTPAFGQMGNWSLSKAVSLPVGMHTIEVKASGTGIGGTAPANVSFGSNTPGQGELTVIVLRM